MRLPRIGLLGKLIAIHLLGGGMVILLAWQVIGYFGAYYFMRLMDTYGIEPEALHATFLRAIYRSLLITIGLGIGMVTILKVFITRKMMAPLTQMNILARKLAKGDYSERVHVVTQDEIAELGHAFNQMADSLASIESMRRNLVANVAHELRTPLNNLRGQIEALQDRLIIPSPEMINSLHEETLRLVRLVDSLYRLSQIDAGTRVLDDEEFNLQELIFSILLRERPRFDEKKIALKINLFPHPVHADSALIAQVVQNLIENLLRYTPERGEARIDLFGEPSSVKCVLTNSGPGITPEDLPYIFERFYRGEKSRSRQTGGAGIGLAIVKQIVEAHGGAVGAESRPGQTEIWFTLPVPPSSYQ
ncbi:sensor histidine kinase [Candidatus Manganitrophus noduliformans]|nr:ATP-binding protein [Candidatus Manganitrophus noduliformans]